MAILSDYWSQFQESLFPRLERVLDASLTVDMMRVIWALDVIHVEKYVNSPFIQWMGRKQLDRRSVARAFIAKSMLEITTTEALIDRLKTDRVMRRLCGFERVADVPSSSTFSRAFATFSAMNLGDTVHKALVGEYVGDRVVMHVSRDSTAVEAREKPAKKQALVSIDQPKRKPGRPKNGEVVLPKEPTRVERQLSQSPEEALSEISRVCDIGCKKDAKGENRRWIGWKTHIDWADGGLPLTVVTTSASVHDSQLAIPMSRLTASKVISLYDLMDAAYDVKQIRDVSVELGHVPIIPVNKRRGPEAPEMEPDRKRRYKERSVAERGNSRLKDEFGLRNLRVRGFAKTHMHIMFGVLVLFADTIRQMARN